MTVIVYDDTVTATMNFGPSSAKTTSEHLADRLRCAIIIGQYKIGQPLNQEELARCYEVSKIPVREALYQLKTEGLVTFSNNKGSVVSSLSADEAEEIYTMRRALEEISLKRALVNMQPADLIQAETALKLIDASTDPRDWPTLNWQFHSSLYCAAGMPKLLETVERLHNNVARYLFLYLDKLAYQTTSQNEHWTLLEACRKKDEQQAVRILRQHLKEASWQTQRFIQQKEGQ